MHFLDLELSLTEWNGKPVKLRVDKITNGYKVFLPVRQSRLDTNTGASPEYKEKLHANSTFH
ncbi:MAG: hypothetical protein H7334_11615 [Ferruginibacter sp.]|nr:hypothetical protein [Ferruginibacter sp.]